VQKLYVIGYTPGNKLSQIKGGERLLSDTIIFGALNVPMKLFNQSITAAASDLDITHISSILNNCLLR
jgi:hypothetical protein